MSPNFEKWLSDHVKGLHVRTEIGDTVYSGMLVRLNGNPYFLTAGHCLQELDQARKTGVKIKEAHILTTNGLPAFSLIDIEQTPLYYLSREQSIDIGLVPLRKWYEIQLGNETFLDERNFIDPPPKFTGCMLVGFPSEFESFQATTINLRPVFISVIPVVRTDPIREGHPPRFYGHIPDFEFSLRGTSGGPIMGFLHDQERGEVKYWIIALQSSWLSAERFVCGTYVSTSLPILLESINQPEGELNE